MKPQRIARQRGYATIFAVLLFVVLALAAFSMFDVGQVSSERIRLQNTSDAAVYSASAFLARDANFTAYTNRAMIANQAAIGQMVALVSWTEFLEEEAINLDRVGTFANAVPGLGQVVYAATQAVKAIATQLSAVIHQIASAGVQVTDQLIGGISEAQQTYHEIAKGAAMDSIASIVKLNDPDIKLGVAESIAALQGFQIAWGSASRLNVKAMGGGRRTDDLNRSRFQEKTALIMNSRDRFTADRNDRWFSFNQRPLVRAEINKYGGTELAMAQRGNELVWNWTSMDTESFWFGVYRLRGFPPRWRVSMDERVPLGWGAAHALDQGTHFHYRRSARWNSAWSNPIAASLAAATDANNNVSNISGLRNYRDFAEDWDPRLNSSMRGGASSKAPGIVLYLVKDAKHIGTRKKFVDSIPGQTATSTLNVQEHGGLAADQLTAVAKSEAYFARPATLWARRDGRIEHGNMYNPYWQVRLVEPDASERLKAGLLSGTVRP